MLIQSPSFLKSILNQLSLLLFSGSDMSNSLPGSSVHGIPQARVLSVLPFPLPGDLPNPGIEPGSLALVGGFFTTREAPNVSVVLSNPYAPLCAHSCVGHLIYIIEMTS